MVGLGGEPGVGKTTLAGAVARASGRTIVAVSLLGCTTADDAVRALGDAVGTARCGDEGATLEVLRRCPPLFFVIDDVNHEATLAPVERLLAGLADTRTLVLSERPLLPRHIEIGDASGGAPGSALLTRLCQALGLTDPHEALAALPTDATALAAFPMGVPAGTFGPLPAAILRPDLRDRLILRRGIAARLGAPPLDVQEPVLRALHPLLDLARGAHPARVPDVRDVLLLRSLRGGRSPHDRMRAELAAAEARLLVIFGQPQGAGAVLNSAAAVEGFASQALLGQARAELAFALGDIDSAWANVLTTTDALGAAGDAAGRATIWRRAAERLAERGEVERADEAWRRARFASRLLADEGGLAAAMRGAAALALTRGEWVGASALHEEAAELPGSPAERTNLRLGELTLALVRGENARIRRGLDAMEEAAGADVLLRANLCRRRADALLRDGDHEGAALAADRAAGFYAQLGEGVARGAALRLGADIAAMAGRPAEAHTRYEAALREQVRARDWAGLVRSLDHAATLEEQVGNTERARLLRDQRAGAQRTRNAVE